MGGGNSDFEFIFFLHYIYPQHLCAFFLVVFPLRSHSILFLFDPHSVALIASFAALVDFSVVQSRVPAKG